MYNSASALNKFCGRRQFMSSLLQKGEHIYTYFMEYASSEEKELLYSIHPTSMGGRAGKSLK